MRKVIGVCYSDKKGQLEEYYKVEAVAKEHNETMSTTGRVLIRRGLDHRNNPHPLFEDPKARSSVEPTIREEEQKVNTVNSSVVEPVSGEQSQVSPSGAKLTPDDKADRSTDSTLALDKKKAPEEDKSNAGWIILGIAGAGLFTWLIRRWTKKVDQVGGPNQIVGDPNQIS